MEWGIELWDQVDTIETYTSKGIDFCTRYSNFLKERSSLENDYASKLKKIVNSYRPKKKEKEEMMRYSHGSSFLDYLQELHDKAGQHETVAEQLNEKITKPMQALIHELKSKRKKAITDIANLQNNLNAQINQYERSRKAYEKAYRDQEKAEENFKRCDADIHQSKADVTKAKDIAKMKENQCTMMKGSYAQEHLNVNKCRKEYYSVVLPREIKTMQDLEKKRIEQIAGYIDINARVELSTMPILEECFKGMQKASVNIKPDEDNKIFAENNKTGNQYPADFPFENLASPGAQIGGGPVNPGQSSNRGSNSQINQVDANKHNSMKASDRLTLSTGKQKKRGGIFAMFGNSKGEEREDFGHLPISQQKKKLNEKINQIKETIATENKSLAGIIKMHETYTTNPKMGDPNTMQPEIQRFQSSIDSLNKQLAIVEQYLVDCTHNSSQDHDSSFTRPPVNQVQQSAPAYTPTPQSKSSTKPPPPDKDVAPPAYSMNQSCDSFDDDLANNSQDDEEEDEDESYEVIGQCTALYQFDSGDNEGSINMVEKETLSLLERDQGDGWTRVRNMKGDQGFVPTSYIECTFN